MINLKNQTAIVTGGTRGIGWAIAQKLASYGANMVITYGSPNSKAKAEENVAELKKYNVKAKSYQCNAADFDATKVMVDQIVEEFKTIDILVNNAGITKDGLILTMDQKQFQDVIDVNLNGVFYMTKHVTKYMMKARKGSIVNISSVVGVSGNAGQINYAAAKAGVIGITKTTAKELGKRNIRCNAIAPGFIETKMTAKLSEKILDEVKKASQLKRLGQPEDIASAVAFLCSDAASFITGQVLNVDGGMLI